MSPDEAKREIVNEMARIIRDFRSEYDVLTRLLLAGYRRRDIAAYGYDALRAEVQRRREQLARAA